MTQMSKPDVKETKALPAPARVTDKPLRFETPDEQLGRDKRKMIGRDRFKIDLAGVGGAPDASGLNLPTAQGGTADQPGARRFASSLNLPRL